jgi:hypothetical protein
MKVKGTKEENGCAQQFYESDTIVGDRWAEESSLWSDTAVFQLSYKGERFFSLHCRNRFPRSLGCSICLER